MWDDVNCLRGGCSSCERFNWFCKDLPEPTTDDVELRVCADQIRADEDVYLDEIKIYVQ